MIVKTGCGTDGALHSTRSDPSPGSMEPVTPSGHEIKQQIADTYLSQIFFGGTKIFFIIRTKYDVLEPKWRHRHH